MFKNIPLLLLPGMDVTKTKTNQQLLMANNKSSLEAKPFVYKPPGPAEDVWNGPDIVRDAIRISYCKHVRSAEVPQQAGGYHEEVVCYRALQDAMADLVL